MNNTKCPKYVRCKKFRAPNTPNTLPLLSHNQNIVKHNHFERAVYFQTNAQKFFTFENTKINKCRPRQLKKARF